MLKDLTINGKQMKVVLSAAAHLSADLTYSQRQTTNLLLTVVDRDDHSATKALYAHLDEDADCTLDELELRPDTLTTGGTAQAPTLELSFKVKSIAALEKRTGGHSWGNTDVSAWAKAEIRAVGGDPFVQHGLGERDIERKEPEGDHSKPESSHDVLAEMAKQVGAWYYDTGQHVVLARPSWLASQPGIPKYDLVWDDWANHSEALLAAPSYRVDFNARPWEGRETLTITLSDTSDHGPAHKARPGHLIHYSGKAAPADPLWIITEVTIPDHHDEPVTITAWRPVDPPEIVPESAAGDGAGEAGVPTGPIGQAGWNGEQLVNAAEIVREGQRRTLPRLAYELAVATAMGESSLRNLGYGDSAGPDSRGLFQQRAEGWGSASDRMTPHKAAGFFYGALVAQPYQDNYANGAYSLPASNIGAVYIGPGKTANAASVTIHRVQVNADPYHYVRFWSDAKLVVDACINAANNRGSGRRPGEIGKRIEAILTENDGRYVDVDGAYGAQCYDWSMRFITELTGIGNISANGKDFYRHPALMGKFTAMPPTANLARGDVGSWSGSSGAYSNGGFGHTAVFSHSERGQMFWYTQNPGPVRVVPLSSSGLLGVMRANVETEGSSSRPSGM